MARNTTRVKIMDALVDTLAAGSLVGASLVAPNGVKVIGDAYLRYQNRRQKNREMRSILRYMHRQALITIDENDNEYTVSITDKGRHRLVRFQFENLNIPPPQKWDEKWRIVLFDIPERHGAARRALTEALNRAGFKLLQRSVWVHPFDCREQVELIKYVYPQIKPHVFYMETAQIDCHNDLVKRFHRLLENN